MKSYSTLFSFKYLFIYLLTVCIIQRVLLTFPALFELEFEPISNALTLSSTTFNNQVETIYFFIKTMKSLINNSTVFLEFTNKQKKN